MLFEYKDRDSDPKMLKARTSADLILDLITHGLFVNDDAHSAIAVELFSRFGERGYWRVLQVALNRDNQSEHRLRSLYAIRQFRIVPDRAVFKELRFLTLDPDPEVAAAAEDLLGRLSEPIVLAV
jgi:hypothetical protein